MKKGFTLIELLVVVLIIGILSAIALPQYQKTVEKSRSAEALMNIKALQQALDVYLLEQGYPSSNRNVYFIGNNAENKDVLDVDITGGMDCSVAEGLECSNRDFAYYTTCSNSSCQIGACRLRDGNNKCFASGYELILYKTKATDKWEKQCQYIEGETDYICKGLESQGFERTTC